ncbi:sodium/potassium/calcium exchanger 6, mitochondrial-like [Drosophila serrata]|uniref:sodium/potassium/calcium exchanger 6, mitochondrial-like n=1 Tax=Drosophila serrata TaxID=7274 RepID=UPI000A1D15FC|nr:sodium/potassium/calcium exchanger 6, mitochondrial-like [Drosophila serrata]
MDIVEVKDVQEEFYQFMANMTCLSVMNLDYPGRCLMVRKLKDCDRYTNIINYFELMYCVLKVSNLYVEIAVICFFILIYILMFCIVFVCINEYYLPALKIAAIRFRMNEYLAGVILVGVANSTPDFMLNLSAVRSGSPTMNIAMANALTSICVMGGTICVIMPFKINGACVFRDLVFIILIVQLIRVLMESTTLPDWVKGLIVFLIYPIYLAVNIIDLVLMRYNIRKLRREINLLRYEPSSPHVEKKLYNKVLALTDLEVDGDFQILRLKTHYGIFRGGVYVTPKPMVEPKKVDVESNRTVLHSENNPKNRFLFAEFFLVLNPIDPEQWLLSGKLGRLKMICMAPVLFALRLTIPMVNYTLIKHGWSKLLNCLQIVINPCIVFLLLESVFNTSHLHGWVIHFSYDLALWSLLVTVPLSLLIFMITRTDIPPHYHKLFVFPIVITVVTFVWICSWEMEVIVTIICSVLNQSGNYMTVTFTSFSRAVPDMIAYIHLTMHGYGKMAFGGIIGGIVFDMVSNVGAHFAKNKAEHSHMLGDYGETLYIFLMLTICSTIFWSFVLDFNVRRSGGIFLWCLYGMFFIYVTLMEIEVIHDFTADPVIEVID